MKTEKPYFTKVTFVLKGKEVTEEEVLEHFKNRPPVKIKK